MYGYNVGDVKNFFRYFRVVFWSVKPYSATHPKQPLTHLKEFHLYGFYRMSYDSVIVASESFPISCAENTFIITVRFLNVLTASI